MVEQANSPLPTDEMVEAGAAIRAKQRAARYGEEAIAGDVTLVDQEEARELYLAMQSTSPVEVGGLVGRLRDDSGLCKERSVACRKIGDKMGQQIASQIADDLDEAAMLLSQSSVQPVAGDVEKTVDYCGIVQVDPDDFDPKKVRATVLSEEVVERLRAAVDEVPKAFNRKGANPAELKVSIRLDDLRAAINAVSGGGNG